MPDYADSGRQATFALRQETFLGGVHDFVAHHLIPQNAAVMLENCDIQGHGTVRRRGGLRIHRENFAGTGTLANPSVPLLLKSHVLRGRPPFLVGAYRANINTSRVIIDDGSGGVLEMDATHTFSEEMDAVQLLDRIYFMQPGQPPLFWEPGEQVLKREVAGAGNAGTSIPYLSSATYYQGRAWGIGDLAKPDLVYFSSALQNAETSSVLFNWDKDFQAFRMLTGRTVAIQSFRNSSLIVFTDRGIEQLEPTQGETDSISQFMLCCYRTTLTDKIGCISKHTVRLCGEEIVFMDQEGHIRSLQQTELDENRGVTNQPLSFRISNVINRQSKGYLKKSHAAFSKGIYWVAFPTNDLTEPTELWGWSFRDQMWIGPYRFGFDHEDEDHLIPMTIGGIASHRFDQDDERLYVLLRTASGGGAINTYVALDPLDFTDDGILIPVRIESRVYALDQPQRRKTWVAVQHELRFIHAPGDQSFDVVTEARPEESDFESVGTVTMTPDAAPALPSPMPFTPTPYGRQTKSQPLTSIARGRGLQLRTKIRDEESEWELINQTIYGVIDNEEYNE